MPHPFIVYLKNKTSPDFAYKADVANIARMEKGYRITFGNGRSYLYSAENVKYYPFQSTRKDVRIYERGELNKQYNQVHFYGSYLVFSDGERHSHPVENNTDIEISVAKKHTEQTASTLHYFKKILQESSGISFAIPVEDTDPQNPNEISSDILLKALDNIDVQESRSALSAYLDGVNPASHPLREGLIYPFGCNESQKLAVETALGNSISIIEGPPGTGKTQTILNIIANLIVDNKTVAIVSNNNSAVANVGEKLKKYGYERLLASLGNKENKTSFFDKLKKQTAVHQREVPAERLIQAQQEARDLEATVTGGFQYRNRLAQLKTDLSDAEIQYQHVQTEQPLAEDLIATIDKKFKRKWDVKKALQLKNILSSVDLEKKPSFMLKLRLLFQHGLFDLKTLAQYGATLLPYVNHKFYQLHTAQLTHEIQETQSWLSLNDEKANLQRFIDTSKEIFDGVLHAKYKNLGNPIFDITNYRKQFPDFINYYPVVLSSTLSLHSSIPDGYLFDYLIIDESSQVDIIKAALCLSCCRNVIVVGDSMQLAHIVDKQSEATADHWRAAYNIPPAYDYVGKNILASLKTLYQDNMKSVLLKEHYRCHPSIIGFCNKKYYNNNLLIMTSRDNHPFKIIETNISGEQHNYNQRQIDETNRYIQDNYHTDYARVGVIAPFRKHANGLRATLPNDTEADTIHKFQGREKDVIIYNTVSNTINAFTDNPNLINVAVSRAINEFIVIKPASMELPHGTHIGDLMRYITYTSDPKKTIFKGRIRSVFDLLYKEYEKAFISFQTSTRNVKGSPAEIIVNRLLREKVLKNYGQFASIDFVREYRLTDLVQNIEPFNEDEIRFIRHNSRIDFLLYNNMDKSPILAIEVDGVTFHKNPLQKERDKKKNHILETIGLPLLRLSTDGHNEEVKIVEKLHAALR